MNIIKWIIVSCCLIGWYFIVKDQRISELKEIFRGEFSGNTKSELNSVPTITDLDSNGNQVIITAPFNSKKLLMYKVLYGKMQLTKEQDFNSKSFPIYMTVGYDTPYDYKKRTKIIVVIMRDFEVLCFDFDLKLKWRQNFYKSQAQAYVQEVSALVVPYQIQQKYQGGIIFAFRTSNSKAHASDRADEEFEEDYRITHGQTYAEQKDDIMNDYDDIGGVPDVIEHINYYCVSSKDGQMIWQHLGDEEDNSITLQVQKDEVSEYKNSKVIGRRGHDAHQINWEEFNDAVFESLPHTWSSYYDTSIEAKHFSRDMINNPAKYKFTEEDFNNVVSDPDRIQNPNVLVVHHMNGIEVVHLYSGKPLLHVTMAETSEETQVSFADLNGDDNLDAVFTYGTVEYFNSKNAFDSIQCYAQAYTLQGYIQLFYVNVCEKNQRFDLARKYDDRLKRVQILPALLIPNSEVAHDGRHLFDTYVLNSNGLLTSIKNDGTLKWQIEIDGKWKVSTDRNKIFKPSLSYFYDKTSKSSHNIAYLIAQGSDTLNVIDEYGSVVAHTKFSSDNVPIMKPIVTDINDDNKKDIIIVTSKSIIGYEFMVVPSIQFLPALISVLVCLIAYSIYIMAITYYKKTE